MKIILLIALLLLPAAAIAQNDRLQTHYQCSRWTTNNQMLSFYVEQGMTFNSKQWITTQYLRRSMLGDFLKRYPVIGMTRKEVKKRLGPPWRTGPDPLDENYPDTGWYMLEGGFNGNAQTESFEIAYESGKVVAYRQIAQWAQ